MKRQMYIEQKTHGNRTLDDRGPAVIGEVRFSKTGRTIYYKNRVFRRLHKGGIYGNYCCVDTGDEFWITGVKKDGSNRMAEGPVVHEGEI